MDSHKNLAIVYAVNNNLDYCAKCLHSILTYREKNPNIPADIYIIVDNQFKFEQQINETMENIKFIHIDEHMFSQCNSQTRHTKAALYRLAIFNSKVFPLGYENVLYLDCDTEFKKSIQELLDTPFEGENFFGVVAESDISKKNDTYLKTYAFPRLVQNKGDLEIEKDDIQFQINSGVFLLKYNKMNELISENEIFEVFQNLIKSKELKYPDQDILTFTFQSKNYSKFFKIIQSKYNYTQYSNFMRCEHRDVVIAHYPTNVKYQYLNDESISKKFYENFLAGLSIDVDDLLKNSFMVHVEKYEDRLELERILFKYHNIPFPQVFYGTTQSGGCKTPANNSHLNLIQHAMKENLPYILVFEDDVYPMDNVLEHLKHILSHIPKNTELIQIGYAQNKNASSVKNEIYDIIQRKDTYCMCAYILFEQGYQKTINLLKDGYYIDTLQNNLFSQIVKMPLFIQYNFGESQNNKRHSYDINRLSYEQRMFVLTNYTPIENILNNCEHTNSKYQLKKYTNENNGWYVFKKQQQIHVQFEHKSIVKLPYFCNEGKNFGDNIGKIILRAISNNEPVLKKEEFPNRLLFIGSTLDNNSVVQHGGIKDGDIVYGSGCLYEQSNVSNPPNVQIRLVRGPMTRQKLISNGIDCPPNYGDPGILAPFSLDIGRSPSPKYDIGLALHQNDMKKNPNNIIQLANENGVKIINVYDKPQQVCKDISECRRIFSSALHPIIVAEAMGIPATWVVLSNLVEGNGFKFYDYYLGSNRKQNHIKCMDWRNGKTIDFNISKTTNPPIFNVSTMLKVFPYDLKENIFAQIMEYFYNNNVKVI